MARCGGCYGHSTACPARSPDNAQPGLRAAELETHATRKLLMAAIAEAILSRAPLVLRLLGYPHRWQVLGVWTARDVVRAHWSTPLGLRRLVVYFCHAQASWYAVNKSG